MQKQNQIIKKRICIGVLAHVDAGKTTLSEAILYRSGALRTLGRVDHQNAFLDTDSLERERGITIFSKQAVFQVGDTQFTLLDTPGHVDFSAEMERTLQVLDCAILVINGADGVQGHTETLWQLLARYKIPTFIFVNKMDQPGADRAKLLSELSERLDTGCVDFTDAETLLSEQNEAFLEQIALQDDALLERYLAWTEEKEAARSQTANRTSVEKGDAAAVSAGNTARTGEKPAASAGIGGSAAKTANGGAADGAGPVNTADIADLIASRKLFPCWFGSALKLESGIYAAVVDAFLRGLARFSKMPAYGAEFAARVFKITRDAQGTRLTHMKIIGGSLRVRTQLSEDEKVNQIRIYSGERFEAVDEAEAGCVCAVTGLSKTHAGQGLGAAQAGSAPVLEPVLNYQLIPPESCDVHSLFAKLKTLEEEIPELHLVWNSRSGEIHAHLMGEVQTEILKELIASRFGTEVSFGAGKILYKETIAAPVEGVGHFEPLRHYAEVHLLLEPLARGSGLEFAADCSEDMLDRNWQRLVLQHLGEREYPGVLVGAPITDMRITLVAGRAHQKHTEGGDFREATCRALRQGLRKAESILLEPVYHFRLDLPAELSGRAMSDIQRMDGSFEPPVHEGERAVIIGEAAVAAMQDYPKEVAAYTRGRGRLNLRPAGYAPCRNADEVIEAAHYDPEADLENPTGSVFCAHGAGFLVSYNEVEQYMHLEAVLKPAHGAEDDADSATSGGAGGAAAASASGKRANEPWKEAGRYIGDKELEEIFVRTFGPIKERSAFAPQGSGRKQRGWNGAEQETAKANAAADGAEKSGSAQNPAGDARSGSSAQSGSPAQNGSPAAGGKDARAQRQSGAKNRTAAAGNGTEKPEEYLLVDGYNIIFAWDELKALAADNLDGARGRLLDILSNYQGFTKKTVIAVFDAYRVQGHVCEELMFHNVFVVYTREAQTADQYIERLVHKIRPKHHVTVATSDRLEQIITWGQGCTILSARGFQEEVERVEHIIRTEHLERQQVQKNRLADYFPPEQEKT